MNVSILLWNPSVMPLFLVNFHIQAICSCQEWSVSPRVTSGSILARSYATGKIVLQTHKSVMSLPSKSVGSEKDRSVRLGYHRRAQGHRKHCCRDPRHDHGWDEAKAEILGPKPHGTYASDSFFIWIVRLCERLIYSLFSPLDRLTFHEKQIRFI